MGKTGHLWQNRFFSCPLDDEYLWRALRYIEQNPVRAGLVATAEDYPWSSARAHLGGIDETHMLDLSRWSALWTPMEWREYNYAGGTDRNATNSAGKHRRGIP